MTDAASLPTDGPTDPFRYEGERDATVKDRSVGASWANDEPDNPCFSCRQFGPPGLRMEFHRPDEMTIESTVTVDRTWAGWSTVIHGGIQAAMLDEVMGSAAWTVAGAKAEQALVTVELNVRFRRPAPIDVPLLVRGVVDHIDGADHHVRGEIVAPDGTVLTVGQSVFRRVR